MVLSVALDRGFTLVEALTSILVLSIALAALVPAMLDGLKRVDGSNEHMIAAEVAQSIMDRAGTDPDLRDKEGVANGRFVWRLETTLAGQPEDRPNWAYDARRTLITVSWGGGGGRSLQLSRITLARKEKE